MALNVGFLDHLVDLPYPYFQMRSAGDLMGRLNSNTTIREILTSGVLSGLLDGFLVLLYLVLLTFASPIMGALVLVLGFLQTLTFLVTRRRQSELTARILHAELAYGIPEHAVGVLAPVGEAIEQFGAHAFRLGTLTGEQTGGGH
jgi:ABC-type bacteriocin/lantibiotic exporter with double-glycine peptidase domain